MFMRAVFATAMLTGLAATAQADIKVIYPPYSYQPATIPWMFLDYDCDHGYRHRHRDMAGDLMAVTGPYYTKTAKIVVVDPPASGQ